MKLIEKYSSRIDIQNIKTRGGYNWLNPQVKNIPLKNVIQLQFINLYPNIISGIVESGLHLDASDGIVKTLENYKNQFDYFNNNRMSIKNNPEEYKNYKTTINSFYGKLGFLSQIDKSPNFAGFVTEYLRYYYDDLLKRNSGAILYVDTDTIFYAGDVDLMDFNVPYDTEVIDYIFFSDLKKYVMAKDEIISKGYHKNAQEAIDLLKRYIRNDKIEELGI
jgi:hypothetical protein